MDERLKILYMSHYFPPEVNAPAARVSEMAQRWAENGADVTVLTCFPNHPNGIIPEEYRGMWHCRERRGDVNVVRTYVYAAVNKGLFRRIINYLSFMFSSIFVGTGMSKRPDILIATSPQFFVAVAGYIISRIKRCKFVFEVRDLWPEEIVAVGAIRSRIVIRALEAIEMFLYRRADIIVAVAQGTIDLLKARGIHERKMALIPNGVDIDFFAAAADGRRVREQLGIDGKFVVGYIGTHGMAHKLEMILQAAAKIRQRDEIRFLFVGDGAEKARLVRQAVDLKLTNVIFRDQVPREKVPEYYAACDICLVPLRKAELFTRNIPSKIYEIMACGRPIIISTEGESRRLVESSGAGIGARPEDADDLAKKIVRLWHDGEACRAMGHSGYSFVLANSSRKRLADDYLAILKDVVDGSYSPPAANKIEIKAENKYGAAKGVRVKA
jgi:glycosyltransferase involved in cell wall biosynthesis